MTDLTDRPPHESGFTKKTVANPFFDTIRQNVELSQGITERIALELPDWVVKRVDELPFEWLRQIVRKASTQSPGGHTGGEALEDLAMQFYRIELGEQKRLHGVMDHHSRESAAANRAVQSLWRQGECSTSRMPELSFPYSITAGIEKGAKNRWVIPPKNNMVLTHQYRYRNIWPFEHARVRLLQPVDGDQSDYINASYVQPRGTSLKYIATQGPLASTFADFWTLCWEQNVSVIVMLTRKKEGDSVKCGHYWCDGSFGPLSLKVLREEGPVDVDASGENDASGRFDFGTFDKPQENAEETIIRRVLELRNSSHPDSPPRRVTQLQYIGWPDLNVPNSPKHLLELIKEINELRVAEKRRSIRTPNIGQLDGSRMHSPGPVLVHCSAGVGRTGSFVIIDAILDAVRRETRAKMMQELAHLRKHRAGKAKTPPEKTDPSPNHTSSILHLDDANAIRLGSGGRPLTSVHDHSVKKRRSDLGGTGMQSLTSLIEEDGGHTSGVASPGTSSLRNPVSPRKRHHPNNSATELTSQKLDKLAAPLSRALESLKNSERGPFEVPSSSIAMDVDSNNATGGPASPPRGDFTGSHTPGWKPLSISPLPMEKGVSQTPINFMHTGQPKPTDKSSSEDSGGSMDWYMDSTNTTSLHSPFSSVVDGGGSGSSQNAERRSTKALSPLQSSIIVSSLATNKLDTLPEKRRSPTRSMSASLVDLLKAPADPAKPTTPLHSRPPIPRALTMSPTTGDEASTRTSSEGPDHQVTPLQTVLSGEMPQEQMRDAGDDCPRILRDAQRVPKHSRRHPQSTAASASDYVSPRMIRLPRDVSKRLRDIDDPGPGESMSLARSTTHSTPIPIPKHSPAARVHSHRSAVAADQGDDDDQWIGNPDGTSSSDSSPSSPPSPLAAIVEPVREVLEDMRQQRMSLCQSLRQYVFVHLAIIIGALGIVDEVKAELLEQGVHSPIYNDTYVSLPAPRQTVRR